MVTKQKHLTRRAFLGLGGAGLAAVALAACAPPADAPTPSAAPTPTPNPDPSPTPAPATPTSAAMPGEADVELALTATPTTVSLFAGAATQVWRYQGEALKGDPSHLQALPDTYLGPIIRMKKGQRLRVNFTSDIPQETIVHWHGLHAPADMDGHPRFAINRGESYLYDFRILNRAGTYWYHPHPHGITGPQVYAGLAGFFLVSDDEEQALGLPAGEFDIPLVIQDRLFDANNQLAYLTGGMMDRMMGFLGDQILVNGKPDFTLDVATRPYRLRLLNGSNSRIYKLAWDDGSPLTVIGNDGGLLEKPVQRPYITLAPAERVELWVDFSDRPVGSEMTLQSLPFTVGGGGMMGGMMGGGMNASEQEQGAALNILTARIAKESNERPPLPKRLSTIQRLSPADAVTTRTITLAMTPGRGWTLNGRTFEMTAVAADERVKLGTTEIWEFINNSGGMETLPHPIHMHGQQFQVLERRISRAGRAAWESLSDGFVDEGWKDTVLVMPGERVRVIRRFDDFTGLFLYHCHNLEHEDMGMMRNFEIVA